MTIKENVFKSFDKIGVGTRAGVIISETTKGYKVEMFSAYNDEREYIYYIPFTKEFPKGTDWNKNWNEYNKNWEVLIEYIRQGYIKPYRTIRK
jgi:hypothetical protein